MMAKEAMQKLPSLVFKYLVVIPLVTLVLGIVAICISNGGVENTIASLLRVAIDFTDCNERGADLICLHGEEGRTTISDFANQLAQIIWLFYLSSILCGWGGYMLLRLIKATWIPYIFGVNKCSLPLRRG